MNESGLIKFGIFLLCNAVLVTPLYINPSKSVVFKGNGGSMFGFTVALHKGNDGQGWVLVGAPEAQSSFQDPNRVSKGGAVYKCRADRTGVCEEVLFDRQGITQYANREIDQKSHQWLGATLIASGRIGGPIVACAPRYVWFTKNLNRREPVGTCFVSDGAFQNSLEYSPCRMQEWGYHRRGYCQAGISAAINKDGDRLFLGAPGSYYWQGQVHSIDAHAKFDFTTPNFPVSGYGAKGTVYQQSLETKPPVFSTKEGEAADDDSYMGYSMVAGHFQESNQYEGIAVGMPNANGLRGKVLLFSWNLVNYKNITANKKIGSNFGYSITAADVNGDKKLDLIVGAPMHTEKNKDFKYDVGRVYIFYQSSNVTETFSTFHSIDGISSKSRFGHALSTLGDLNKDGFDDFAVGAPYAGEDGRGAVYIYYGLADGKPQTFGQVIYASQIETNVPVAAFGFSIAGGVDLDGNGRPDVAVGAYVSDAVILFT